MSKTGQTPGPNRALTIIEQNVEDSVVNLILDNLTETCRLIANMEFRIQARQTRPQMLQVTGPHRDRQEIERQGGLKTSPRPKARVVRLHLQLANAAAAREKAHATVR